MVVFDQLFPQKLQLFHGRQAQAPRWGEIGGTAWVGVGRGARSCKWGRRSSWSSSTASLTSRRSTSSESIRWIEEILFLLLTSRCRSQGNTTTHFFPARSLPFLSTGFSTSLLFHVKLLIHRYEDENSLGNEAIFLNAGKKPDDCKMVARAIFSFQAQNNRELSFKKGDVIYIKKQVWSNENS